MLHRLDGLEKAEVLLSLLPALMRYRGKTLAADASAAPEDLAALKAVGAQILPPEAQADIRILFAPLPGRSALERMDRRRAEELLESGQISGALSAAVRTCLQWLEQGGAEAAVLDPAAPHALLLCALDQQTPGLLIMR